VFFQLIVEGKIGGTIFTGFNQTARPGKGTDLFVCFWRSGQKTNLSPYLVSLFSFSAQQLQQIEMGARKIDGYTWHHHQDNGRMQLIPEMVHKKTGHIGGEAMGGGM